MNDTAIDHMMYVDDIVIFSPSISGLRQLGNVLTDFISVVKAKFKY